MTPSAIVQDYINITVDLIQKLKEIPNFNRTADFDIINDKLTKLWRLMTDEERRYTEDKLKR